MINRQSQARGKFANRKKLMKKFARIILRIILTIFHFIMCRIEILYEGVPGIKLQVTSDELLNSPSSFPCVCL